MKIAPLKVSDRWYGRIINDTQVHADSLSGVPIESVVEMELVELLHGGPEDNYRPYLHMRGELVETIPAVELPYGVTALAMRRGTGLPVDAYYDFTQEQLVDLVGKGYFTQAFEVPEAMSGIPWTLPGKADFLVVAPDLSDEPPLVFMNVHHQSSLELDEANSGYELAAYFPDYSSQAEASQHVVDPTIEPERAEVIRDVFSDIDFEEHQPIDMPAARMTASEAEMRNAVPDGVFSRLVAEIQATQPQEVEAAVEPEAEEEEIKPGSAWDVYLRRVSPGVTHVLSGEHLAVAEDALETEPETELGDQDVDTEVDVPKGFLDLTAVELEPELTSLHEQVAKDEDTHRKAAERAAARRRADLGEDDGVSPIDAEPAL